MNFCITGYSGFVGQNLINYPLFFKSNFKFITRKECSQSNFSFNPNTQILIHLAGKAHDLQNVTDSNEYYKVNTDLTKKLYDAFLISDINVFITLSSVKAVADSLDSVLTENSHPNPITHYGKSKLLAEQYILSKPIPEGKRVYILRPCMIHGPGNKGNLNLLYQVTKMGFPWPLGAFENKRSFCSIDNLCFIINELIKNSSIPSGVYNIADDEPIATNELIKLIADSQGKKYNIWNVPIPIINFLSEMGNFLKLPFNSERLKKLTENYIVSNNKIVQAINKPLPLSTKDGLMKTLNSFNTNAK